MPTVNLTYWRPYLHAFNPRWYLRDVTGSPLLYLSGTGKPEGYVYDLANPAYRAWAAKLLTTILKAAPYSGVLLDSADQINGSVPWKNIQSVTLGSSPTSLNRLLCRPAAPVDGYGDCPRMAAWNSGLASFVAEVTRALRPLGDIVAVNGIAPSPVRRLHRNLGITRYATFATNEDFCYHATAAIPSSIVFEDLPADVELMRAFAGRGRGVIEVTDYRSWPEAKTYADYCLGGFLIGWQPESSYYIYHANYHDPLVGAYPEIPEQDLDLGLPATEGYGRRGNLLYRRYQHGLVVVNAGDRPASFTAPAAAVAFKNGHQAGWVKAGTQVSLLPRSAKLYLETSYLCPRASGPGGRARDMPPRAVARSETYLDGRRVRSRYPVAIGGYVDSVHTLMVRYYLPKGRVLAMVRCVATGRGQRTSAGARGGDIIALLLGAGAIGGVLCRGVFTKRRKARRPRGAQDLAKEPG
jgi:hypothetical protein